MSEFGPKITIKTERSCCGCKALESESYAVQSDTGFYHYCAHPSLPTKVRIPGHGTDTPDWCAALATPAAAAEPASMRMALQMLYDETADYIRLNNLGGMENQCMRMARAALATPAAESKK